MRDRDSLLRFVLSPDRELVPDLEARLPGRGAYTCISSDCLRSALKARQFNRSFKGEVAAPGADELVKLVQRIMRERILGYLGLANRAGKVIAGGSLVSESLGGNRRPDLVLVATDVSGTIGERIVELATRHAVPVQYALTKDEFGAILGKSPRSAVAVRSTGFAGSIMKETERYRNFLGEVQYI